MRDFFRTMALFGCCFLFLLISGCGGGGEGGSSENTPPEAYAGEDQIVSVASSQTRTVTLSGTATDSDGTIATQQWSQTAGTFVTLSGADSATATFTVGATEATYTFSYTVTDDDGAEGIDEVTITVIVNNPPTADAGNDQTVSVASSQTRTVTLSGTASDGDGTIVAHQWSQTAGTDVTLSGADSATATFTVNATETTYTFSYTVTDDDGATATDEVSVTVIINSLPVVNAGTDQTFTLASPATQTVNLTATAADSDGTIQSHLWTQTSGTATLVLSGADTQTVSFTVPSATDAYTFSYTATDDDGGQATDTVTVYVTGILFSDAFSAGTIDDDWYIEEDDTGNGQDWAIDSGWLLQSNHLESGAFAGTTSYHAGTYIGIDETSFGGASDYRFSVTVKPLSNNQSGFSEGNDVGVMFRYQDADNYYRVSRNTKYGFTRFEKRRNGVFETLAVNAIGYVDDQEMTITAEVNGDAIIVWIDDIPVFATVDSSNPVPSGGVALYCQDKAQFDNVQITDPPLSPLVVISTPLAYSVTPNDSLEIEAVVLNPPAGGSVGVTIDGGGETGAALSGDYYTTTVSGLSATDHDIMVRLKNADGEEVSDDLNSMVGTGGDYIITVGDSITNGVGDDDPSNNDSDDGRIVSIQGYQALLANSLATASGLPVIVFNEGIEGEDTYDLVNHIDSILERHPDANKVLLMIGTNDSAPIREYDPDTEYKPNLNDIVTIIDDDNGKSVWLAKILPAFVQNSDPLTLDTDRNTDFITQYNTKIEEIVNISTTDNTYLGPDFYTTFYDDASLYTDYLHPNDDGYAEMALGWFDALTN